MGELLLIDLSHFYGVLSHLFGSNTAASPKPHCNMDDGSWLLEPWSALHSFQAAQWIWAPSTRLSGPLSSRQLSRPWCLLALLIWECLSAFLTACLSWWRERPEQLVPCKGPPEAFELLTSWLLRSLPLEHPFPSNVELFLSEEKVASDHRPPHR